MGYIRLSFVNMDEDHIYHLYIDKVIYLKLRDGWVISPPDWYRIRKDKSHSEKNQEHIHIYMNGELVVINKDGSKSHDSNGLPIKIPKKLYDWLKENFKDYIFSEDRMVRFSMMSIPVLFDEKYVELIL